MNQPEKRKTDSPHQRAALIQWLRDLQAAGITHVERPAGLSPTTGAAAPEETPKTAAPAAAAVDLPAPSSAAPTKPVTAPAAPATSPPTRQPVIPREVMPGNDLPLADRIQTLDQIRCEVAECRVCPELASTRTQTVFGSGSPEARLCFIGEAPGADEDRQGVPFIGRAGQLLTKIIEACTLSREDVYILNVLKCRPPNNRNPTPDEAANCRGFLDRQLQVIRPEFICCLGASAAKTLLDTNTSIGKMRGRFYLYQDIRVLVTYHPAYLLRNPSAKRMVWDDMQLLMKEMGVSIPASK